jgi:hypothetical protein
MHEGHNRIVGQQKELLGSELHQPSQFRGYHVHIHSQAVKKNPPVCRDVPRSWFHANHCMQAALSYLCTPQSITLILRFPWVNGTRHRHRRRPMKSTLDKGSTTLETWARRGQIRDTRIGWTCIPEGNSCRQKRREPMPCPVRCISRCGEEKPGVLISRPVSAQTVDVSLKAVMSCSVLCLRKRKRTGNINSYSRICHVVLMRCSGLLRNIILKVSFIFRKAQVLVAQNQPPNCVVVQRREVGVKRQPCSIVTSRTPSIVLCQFDNRDHLQAIACIVQSNRDMAGWFCTAAMR